MIRLEEGGHWLLLEHAAHAALAGEFARRWKNAAFAPPEPFAHVLDAVARHDDSWIERDAQPRLTPEGKPSAFSVELVGAYAAFEEMDLQAYLDVRAAATEQAAARDPYAAVLVSMHTVNLVVEQSDPSALGPEQRRQLDAFAEGQRRRQSELKEALRAQPDVAPRATEAHFQAGFEFLQACDSLSLYVATRYPNPGFLRHAQPLRQGGRARIAIWPDDATARYFLDPYPLDEPEIRFAIPYRRVPKTETANQERFRAAWRAASAERRPVTLARPAS